MHLGGGQPGPVGVHHGFHHVIDQMAYFRRGGVGHRAGNMGKNRVAHAGDFQDSHGGNMAFRGAGAKGAKRPNSRA